MIRDTADMADDSGRPEANGIFGYGDGGFSVVPMRSLCMRQPVCELPRAFQQRLVQTASVLVRTSGERDVADVVSPCLQIRLLGELCGGIPRHDALRGADKRKQCFTAPDADSLVVG